MIEFKFEKVDWEKYEYPGFEIGDTIRELVTRQQFRCRDIATALDLHLGEEDIPGYYKFICIDNPCGFPGTIWTNPELFELIQKKSKQTSENKPLYYGSVNWHDLENRMRNIPNEVGEEIFGEIREGIINQAVEGQDELDQPVRPENAHLPLNQVGDVGVIGHTSYVFGADGRWHIQRLEDQPVEQALDANARERMRVRAEEIIQERRLHDQELAEQLRRAAEAVNPNRRR